MARHSVSLTEPARPLGVVVIGAGAIADQHGAVLLANPRARLVGVVDVDAGRASAWARQAGGVPWTRDLAEALAWQDVDACIVCTPNHTHEAIALQIAAAGKHLLVEKPLTIDVSSAQEVVDAFASAGTTLMAAHTHRYYDYSRAVADVISGGSIGRPVFARLAFLGGWIWPDWQAWVLDPAKSGGHALHNGVHLLDLVTWWMQDEPVRVYARGQKRTGAELGIYDYLEMTIEFAGGATAVCEMSRGHRPASLDLREALIVGTDGAVQLPTQNWGSSISHEKGVSLLHPEASNGFAVQLGAWLDAIGGLESAMPPEDAVRAVVLGVAVETSIERGAAVDLDELRASVMA